MVGARIPRPRSKTVVLSILIFCTAGLCSACTKPLSRGWTPFQLALFNPLQVFVEEDGVRGARVSMAYGNNTDVVGLDVGAIGLSKSMTGLQINAAYSGTDNLDGVQIGSLNQVTNRVRGVQLGGVLSHAGELNGLQLAGLHSRAESVTGFQISGMVNETEELRGVQIGIVNINYDRPIPFQILPFISWGYGSASEEDADTED